MHIEPGFVAQSKLILANVTAVAMVTYYSRYLINPLTVVRTLLAALFFSVFMESFSMSVGPSELHFVGAMVIYLTLGFIPTLLGFALGLLLQGILFSPWDLAHLAVNSLSLILPLLALHFTIGKKLANGLQSNWRDIVTLDAAYYSGVTIMVGFWLMLAEVTTPFAAWATFASSYLLIVAIEPLVTVAALALIRRYGHLPITQACFAVCDKR